MKKSKLKYSVKVELLLEAIADTENAERSAVVLLSGGQDSTTLLHVAMAHHGPKNVFALGFNYGQRHVTELDCAATLAGKYDIPYHVIGLKDVLASVGHSALTNTGAEQDTSKPHTAMPDVPASFVPARNALFLTLAYSYAQLVGAEVVYGGMCQTDYSGYPDCREDFVNGLENALHKGYPSDPIVTFRTPLMRIDKRETFQLAHALGGLPDVLELSHTCYNGDHTTRNAWGYGCGQCPSCKLRAKGFAEFEESMV